MSEAKQSCPRQNCFEIVNLICVGIKATVLCPRQNCFECKRKSHELSLLCRNQSNSSLSRDTTASSLNESLMNCPFVSESKQQFVSRDTTASSVNESLMNCPFCVGIKATVRFPRHNCLECKRKSHELSLLSRNQSNSSLLETQLLRV